MKYKTIFDIYKVYEDGTIVNSRTSKQLNYCDNGRGYPITGIKVDGKWKSMTQHKVVALAWLGEKPEGYEVDHIDNDKYNNSVSNLRYVTRRENLLKMYQDGRDVSGVKNANAKLTESQVRQICILLEKGELSMRKIGEKCGASKAIVGNIKYRRQWSHISDGYQF